MTRPHLQAVDGSAPVPPQNLDAEESVLGACLIGPNTVDNIVDLVAPPDFYRHSHGKIFKAILDLHAKSEPVDAITLVDWLQERGELKDVGGRPRIHELAALVPATANAAHYAKIVREMAGLRSLIGAGDIISNLGWERPGDLAACYALAEQALSQATTEPGDPEFLAVGADLLELYAELAQAVESGEPLHGLQTGFPDLDRLTTGFHPGQLIILAARPSMGKSVLGQNIGENAADFGIPSAMFSLEMSRRELQIRALSRETKLSTYNLRTARLTTEELARVKEAVAKLERRPFYIEERSSITPPELAARARRLKRKHGLGLLIVDYLQLMLSDPNGNTDARQQEVASISRSLKQLAKDLHIPILAISQLNRGVEFRADKRPTLSDLRDSGAIEQDGDVVLMLYREEAYKPVDASQAGAAELNIVKNRMGEMGLVNLLFLGRRQTFATPTLPGVS